MTSGSAQQRLERPGAADLALQRAQHLEDLGVAAQPAALLPQRGGDAGRRGGAAFDGQPGADPARRRYRSRQPCAGPRAPRAGRRAARRTSARSGDRGSAAGGSPSLELRRRARGSARSAPASGRPEGALHVRGGQAGGRRAADDQPQVRGTAVRPAAATRAAAAAARTSAGTTSRVQVAAASTSRPPSSNVPRAGRRRPGRSVRRAALQHRLDGLDRQAPAGRRGPRTAPRGPRSAGSASVTTAARQPAAGRAEVGPAQARQRRSPPKTRSTPPPSGSPSTSSVCSCPGHRPERQRARPASWRRRPHGRRATATTQPGPVRRSTASASACDQPRPRRPAGTRPARHRRRPRRARCRRRRGRRRGRRRPPRRASRAAAQAVDLVGTDHHERRGGPPAAGRGRVGGDVHLDARCGGQPQQVVERERGRRSRAAGGSWPASAARREPAAARGRARQLWTARPGCGQAEDPHRGGGAGLLQTRSRGGSSQTQRRGRTEGGFGPRSTVFSPAPSAPLNHLDLKKCPPRSSTSTRP